jgi:hypothetical protein
VNTLLYFRDDFRAISTDAPAGAGYGDGHHERKRIGKLCAPASGSKSISRNPAAITITRMEDGRYVDVNDSFFINGFTREEVIGHTSTELNVWVRPEERRQPSSCERKGDATG